MYITHQSFQMATVSNFVTLAVGHVLSCVHRDHFIYCNCKQGHCLQLKSHSAFMLGNRSSWEISSRRTSRHGLRESYLSSTTLPLHKCDLNVSSMTKPRLLPTCGLQHWSLSLFSNLPTRPGVKKKEMKRSTKTEWQATCLFFQIIRKTMVSAAAQVWEWTTQTGRVVMVLTAVLFILSFMPI